MMAFWNIFKIKPKTPYSICEKTIKKMGYKKNEPGIFLKQNSIGTTIISLSQNGVKIKVYANGYGYGESEFLPSPLPSSKTLKNFIRKNEI